MQTAAITLRTRFMFTEGINPSGTGFSMGHEFTGVVVELGRDVKTVKAWGKVVSPFTVCCMQCSYCRNSCSPLGVLNLLILGLYRWMEAKLNMSVYLRHVGC